MPSLMMTLPSSTAGVVGGLPVELLDLRNEVLRKRNRAFAHHARLRLSACVRCAIEAQPRRNRHQPAIAVDEIRDPELSGSQVDRHFAMRASPQHLSLDRPGRSPDGGVVCGRVFGPPTGDGARRVLNTYRTPRWVKGER
jgi:hypothetical protein